MTLKIEILHQLDPHHQWHLTAPVLGVAVTKFKIKKFNSERFL